MGIWDEVVHVQMKANSNPSHQFQTAIIEGCRSHLGCGAMCNVYRERVVSSNTNIRLESKV